ncbi:HNH endonuclease signature motif containing protein [Mycobacterium kansasii]
MALPPRMSAKIALQPCPDPGLSDCWFWQGAVQSKGYGSVGHQGRVWSTHRLAYELLIGPIPDGLQIDHLCRNRRCCNPAHLEPVTGRVNVLRAVRKATCARGHEYTPENTLLKKGGTQRNCRTCTNEWQRNRRRGMDEADVEAFIASEEQATA